MRTSPSVMPTRALPSGPMRWCVVVAGWVIRDFASPRLLEMSTSSSRSSTENACSSLLDLERHDRPPATHLPLRELVLGVRLEPGVQDPADPRVPLEPRRDLLRAGVRVEHPHPQGLQALGQHPGVERAQRGPRVAHGLHLALDQLHRAQDRAAERASLAVDVLGRGVDDDVGSQVQRALEHGRGEHVVHDDRGAGGVRQSHTARTSTSSCIGLDGDSKKTAFAGVQRAFPTARGRGLPRTPS